MPYMPEATEQYKDSAEWSLLNTYAVSDPGLYLIHQELKNP